MGKKYDAYVKAVKANNEAKSALAQASGGSTKERLQEAQTNAQQAQMIESEAWSRVQEDPQG